MNNKNIYNIDEYIKISNALQDNGYFTYRGQRCSSWLLEPGSIRKIKRTYIEIGESGLLFHLSVDYVLKLLREAKSNKYFTENECDLNILAMLQHYGAATPLLDFTYDPLVALYFACQPPKDKNDVESDGNIFCINYPSQMRSHSSPLRPIKNPSDMDIKTILDDTSHYIWYWRPSDDLCKRSEKQQSVFVFCWGFYWKDDTKRLIDELKVLTISAENKKSILKELEDNYNISEQTLFPAAESKRSILKELEDKHDISEQIIFPGIQGFAKSYSEDKKIQSFSAEEFYSMGEEQYWDGSFEWAAEYYKMAYKKKPDWIDARYKYALALNWDGEQSKALRIIEASIIEMGEKWKLIACKSIFQQGINTDDWKVEMRKAEKIAYDANESSEFKTFVDRYSILPFDFRIAKESSLPLTVEKKWLQK
jgi:hypothetical protein